MVTLFCAVVGENGNAFPVDIDTRKSVGDLKKAIKEEQMFDFAASKLELYLAKKGESWLTEKQVAEGIYDTSDFKPLKVVAASLHLVGLSEKDVAFKVTMEDVKTMSFPVNVVVVVPIGMKNTLAANRRAALSIAISAAEPTEIFVTIEEIRDSEKD
ncbi:CRN-like protein [Plasmopara halstedii]|uniref:CRN-like protein n=1 Tax=Plasmopara halstedii TaxID=4781 RepID=A0A0P1ATQ8_PLAHL|nr:CRN-like protein [Plasmopara halstedii]CEG44706.1 CRN-like protein [Plasmopara halstedii]|eukprot:XP_024581075.1 CRN-like protein [Plasmopara halstedii]